jgi:hypothetical protein
MKRRNPLWIGAALVTATLALAACEPAREQIVDTVEPLSTAAEEVKMAPATGETAASTDPSMAGDPAPTTTETALETAAQPNTRTQ